MIEVEMEQMKARIKSLPRGCDERKRLAIKLKSLRSKKWNKENPNYTNERAQIRENKRVPKKSNIYLITNIAWGGFVKVGRAINVEKRLMSYQTSSPLRDYKIEFSLEVLDVHGVERFIYNKYEMVNEWTKVDIEDIKNDLIKLKNKTKL
tara:strand:+ start:269 stop:718 length:450 start_codon:yes stop_codon:yes gene_type:complete